MPRQLSKTSLQAHIQCSKYGYMYIHERELAQYSAAEERLFESGHEVNDYARATRPGGVLIEYDPDTAVMVRNTRQALADGLPVFEGAFVHDGVIIRADIVEPYRKTYCLVEVKSSTSIKEVHVRDCAIQKWIMEQTGVVVKQVRLMHINNEFVYAGDGDYRGLFVEEDITAKVDALLGEVPGWIAAAKATLAGSKPKVQIGAHCHDPYDCPFFDHCTEGWPAFPLYTLPSGGRQVQQWIQQGYRDIRELPLEQLTHDKHRRVRGVIDEGRPYVGEDITRLVKNLRFPRYYLDFETIAFTVPYFAGTRPYETVPFQWSCDVQHRNGKISHREALFVDGAHPARRVAESLITALDEEGPILVYSSYEKQTINKLIQQFPDLADKLQSIVDRLVDLLPPVRAHYYHPDQHGSWSLKDVLPTIVPDLAYDTLEGVRDGNDAQFAYRQMIGDRLSPEEKSVLQRQMLDYCARDTIGLLEMVRYFSR